MDGAGQRRPKDEDLTPLLDMIWEGQSLRAACEKLGLHVPSTSTWLHADNGRREQYARAREGRAEAMQEEVLSITRAAAMGMQYRGKKVDAAGARAHLEATKWATARMAPKTAPVQRVALSYEHLSPEEIRERTAEVDAQLAAAREAEAADQ